MEDVKRCAYVLHLYLVELQSNLKRIQDLGTLQRNPFIRSPQAKQLLQGMEESMQHCLEATLVFMASLSRHQLCDEAAIKMQVHSRSFQSRSDSPCLSSQRFL